VQPFAQVGPEPCALALTWADALSRIDWQLFATLTFAHCPGPEESERAWRAWRNYIRDRLIDVGPFDAVGPGPFVRRRVRAPRAARRFPLYTARAVEWQQRGSIHFHALLAAAEPFRLTLESLYRVGLALTWKEQAGGGADLQLIRSRALVSAYLAKYVAKAGNLEVIAPRAFLAQAPTARGAREVCDSRLALA
jgi:hypothetical protein